MAYYPVNYQFRTFATQAGTVELPLNNYSSGSSLWSRKNLRLTCEQAWVITSSGIEPRNDLLGPLTNFTANITCLGVIIKPTLLQEQIQQHAFYVDAPGANTVTVEASTGAQGGVTIEQLWPNGQRSSNVGAWRSLVPGRGLPLNDAPDRYRFDIAGTTLNERYYGSITWLTPPAFSPAAGVHAFGFRFPGLQKLRGLHWMSPPSPETSSSLRISPRADADYGQILSNQVTAAKEFIVANNTPSTINNIWVGLDSDQEMAGREMNGIQVSKDTVSWGREVYIGTLTKNTSTSVWVRVNGMSGLSGPKLSWLSTYGAPRWQ